MESNGKGLFYGVIGVATLIVAIIGATFAWFTAQAESPDNQAIITSGTLTITYTDGNILNATNLKPATKTQVSAALNDCLTDTDEHICAKYSFQINNTGSLDAVLDYAETFTSGFSTGALRYVLIKDTDLDTNSFDTATEETFTSNAVNFANQTLAAGANTRHTLVFWLDGATATNDDQNKTLTGSVVINATQTNYVAPTPQP